jgi:hypothetical protein
MCLHIVMDNGNFHPLHKLSNIAPLERLADFTWSEARDRK